MILHFLLIIFILIILYYIFLNPYNLQNQFLITPLVIYIQISIKNSPILFAYLLLSYMLNIFFMNYHLLIFSK